MERWSRSGVAFLIVAGLAIGCYLNTLGSPFISDDHIDIVNNPIIRGEGHLPEVLFNWQASIHSILTSGNNSPRTRISFSRYSNSTK